MNVDAKDAGYKGFGGRGAVMVAVEPARRFIENAPLRILVVDDDPAVRSRLTARNQGQISAATEVAGSLAEATEATRNHPFDLILFALPGWEEGVLWYIDLLNHSKDHCRLILFMDQPAAALPYLGGELTVLRKSEMEGLLERAESGRTGELFLF